MSASWDAETDLAVVGSGGALVAALAAHARGLESLVLEKRKLIGGSTAMSGGVVWMPCNPLLAAAGVEDSVEDAMAYFEAVVGNVGPASSLERRRAFATQGPAMLRFLQELGIRFVYCDGYSDYYAEAKGGKARGRAIEAVPLDASALGEWRARLQPGFLDHSRFPIHTGELARFSLPYRSLRNAATLARVLARTLVAQLRGKKYLMNGASLIGHLLQLAVARGIPVWTQTRVVELIAEGGRVAGVAAEREGRTLRIRARRGVLLGAGGFAHSPELRRRYSGAQPNDASWTSANPGDTGEVLEAAMRLGAATDLLDEAWWIQTSLLPNGARLMHISERTRPGTLIVDAKGLRFVNEAASYMEVGKAMYARCAVAQAVPSWLIFDARFRRRYPWAMAPPMRTPRDWFESGYMKRADSLGALAALCGIDAAGLEATVARFNRFAREGRDPDFHRGEGAYDRVYGDPGHGPNPCLGPVDRPPYHAVAIYPGDVGTCGGLLTDARARVLRDDGEGIEGLYATGNTTATVMGRSYLGPGASIAASMAFAYIAAHAAADAAAQAA
jgi:3-oxosteroid 1-dehydrogenase